MSRSNATVLVNRKVPSKRSNAVTSSTPSNSQAPSQASTQSQLRDGLMIRGPSGVADITSAATTDTITKSAWKPSWSSAPPPPERVQAEPLQFTRYRAPVVGESSATEWKRQSSIEPVPESKHPCYDSSPLPSATFSTTATNTIAEEATTTTIETLKCPVSHDFFPLRTDFMPSIPVELICKANDKMLECITCKICECVRVDIRISQCAFVACDACFKRVHNERPRRCPQCRTSGCNHMESPERNFAISSLSVRCPNHDPTTGIGCSIKVDIGKEGFRLSNHLDSCAWEIKACGHCKRYYPRGRLGAHYVECPSRSELCKCGESVKICDMPDHVSLCGHAEVSCDLCNMKMARAKMAYHIGTGAHLSNSVDMLRGEIQSLVQDRNTFENKLKDTVHFCMALQAELHNIRTAAAAAPTITSLRPTATATTTLSISGNGEPTIQPVTNHIVFELLHTDVLRLVDATKSDHVGAGANDVHGFRTVRLQSQLCFGYEWTPSFTVANSSTRILLGMDSGIVGVYPSTISLEFFLTHRNPMCHDTVTKSTLSRLCPPTTATHAVLSSSSPAPSKTPLDATVQILTPFDLMQIPTGRIVAHCPRAQFYMQYPCRYSVPWMPVDHFLNRDFVDEKSNTNHPALYLICKLTRVAHNNETAPAVTPAPIPTSPSTTPAPTPTDTSSGTATATTTTASETASK